MVVGKGKKAERMERKTEANNPLLHIFFSVSIWHSTKGLWGRRKIYSRSFKTLILLLKIHYIHDGRLNILKILLLSNLMHRFDAISIIVKMYELTIKFIWNAKASNIHDNL